MTMNTPNKLTIFRVILVPFFIILLLNHMDIAAGIVFIIASLTDTLDGYLARKYHQITTFGKFMDPLADKLLVCSALICLVELGRIPSWIVAVIVGRDFIISGFRLIAAERGIVIAANIWGKIKTVVQMIMIILLVFHFGGVADVIEIVLITVAAVLTILSLVIYIKDNINVLMDIR